MDGEYARAWLGVWGAGIAFAALHSLLAADIVKRRAYARGISPQRYRLAYTAIAVITSLIWLAAVAHAPNPPVWRLPGAWAWAGWAVQIVGIGVFIAALRAIDGRAFLGLSAGDPDAFVVRGIYRWMRHPMYTGAMLYLWARPQMGARDLALAAFASLYFWLGALHEERRMLAAHPDYRRYRAEVPMFVPSVRLLGRLLRERLAIVRDDPKQQ